MLLRLFKQSRMDNSREALMTQLTTVDVLIIDDIHFLANKRATQEEFLHTFNAIDGRRRRIVLASDTHPKLIGQFSEQLINRFLRVCRVHCIKSSNDAFRLVYQEVGVPEGLTVGDGNIPGQKLLLDECDQDLPDWSVIPVKVGQPHPLLILHERRKQCFIEAAYWDVFEVGHSASKQS